MLLRFLAGPLYRPALLKGQPLDYGMLLVSTMRFELGESRALPTTVLLLTVAVTMPVGPRDSE